MPDNQQTEVPSSQTTKEARKRLEQELNDIPEVSDKDLREIEQLREQMMAKRQKVERMNQLKRQIAEASEALKQFQQEEGIPNDIDLSFEFGNRQPFKQPFHRQELFIDPVSPLSNHLQASPWPAGYRPTSLPAFDGQCSPKQFLLSYEATIQSFGGDSETMAKSLSWHYKEWLRDGILLSRPDQSPIGTS